MLEWLVHRMKATVDVTQLARRGVSSALCVRVSHLSGEGGLCWFGGEMCALHVACFQSFSGSITVFVCVFVVRRQVEQFQFKSLENETATNYARLSCQIQSAITHIMDTTVVHMFYPSLLASIGHAAVGMQLRMGAIINSIDHFISIYKTGTASLKSSNRVLLVPSSLCVSMPAPVSVNSVAMFR